MTRRRGLGSGLDALIPGGPSPTEQAVRQISVEAIRENRSQPRTRFDEQALDELAASIREHGLIQPLIVSEDAPGRYELIAGERRLRAARRAGLAEVPALIKSATPQQLLELALVENVQRADLNPLEEGMAYQTLKDEFGLSDDLIAQRVGKSRVAIVNARRLIRLIPSARQALLDGTISAGHGRALLRFEQADEQTAVLDLLVRRDLNVREAERLAELAQHGQLAPATRRALLQGILSPSQIQSLLRIEDEFQQEQALDLTLSHGLSARETDQLGALVAEGLPPQSAVAQLRDRVASLGGTAPQSPLPEVAPASEQRESRSKSAEDIEAQRLFEEVLETPVQLTRTGNTIRLTITFFNDEQLQSLYDRLIAS